MDEILEPYRSEENPNVIIIPEVQPPVARYLNVITEETVVGSVPIDMQAFGYVTIEAYDEEGSFLAEWNFDAEYRYVVPVEPVRDGNTVTIPEVEGVIYDVGWEPVSGTIEIPVSGLRVSAATDWEQGWEWDWDAGDFETEWFFEAEIDESIIPPYRSDDDPNLIIIPEPQPPVHIYTTPLQGIVEGSVRIDMAEYGYIQIEAEDEEGTLIGFWEFMGEYITVEPVEPTRDGNTVVIPEIEGVIYSAGDWDTGFEVVSGSIEIPEDGIMITSEADWRTGYEFDWDTVGEIEWFYEHEPEPEPEDEVWWLPYVHVWTNDPRFNNR